MPNAATRIPCARSCRTGRPPQPCRIAHSRTLRCRPTTCQTHDPAGLEMPPSACIASCTRRRASSWCSLGQPQRSATKRLRPPAWRRVGVDRAQATWQATAPTSKPLSINCPSADEGLLTLLRWKDIEKLDQVIGTDRISSAATPTQKRSNHLTFIVHQR